MEKCWRSNIAPASREKIVNRIMNTVQRHMPPSTKQDGVNELLRIARRFEEKIFQGANDQIDYLRRISLKMMALEMVTNNPVTAIGASSSNIGEIEVENMVTVSAPVTFVEVVGPDGKRKRFAEGTRAGFVVDRLNKQLNLSDMKMPVVCVQAYKEGEEPIVYGPEVELHVLGDKSWTLKSVSEYAYPITGSNESRPSKKVCLRRQ